MRNSIQWKLIVAAIVIMLTMHLIFLIANLFDNANINYAASLVRDAEEYRFARALTLINSRKITKGHLAFQYQGGVRSHEKQSFEELDPAPGLTFSILAANRWTHEIDEYEPSYLLESSVNLLLAIEKDLSLFGMRYSYINATLCPTTDRLDRFSELVVLSRILPADAIKKRQKSMDSLSLSCRTLLDVGSCIKQSVNSSLSNSYLVLLEDDLVADGQLLQYIWDIIVDITSVSSSLKKNVGAIVLNVPDADFQFSSFDTASLREFSMYSFGLTVLILFCILPRRYRWLCSRSDLILVCFTFILSLLIVSFIGRPRWANWLLILSRRKTFLYRSRSFGDSSSSALLIPSSLAVSLGKYLWTLNCSDFDGQSPFGLKSSVIFDFLRTHNRDIYTVWPTLFQHRGLYSIYKNDIHDPRMVN